MSNRRPPPLSGDRNPDLGIWLVALLKNHPYCYIPIATVYYVPPLSAPVKPHADKSPSHSRNNGSRERTAKLPTHRPVCKNYFQRFQRGRSNRPETLRISTPQSRPRQRPTPKIQHKPSRSGQRVHQRPIALELQIPSFSSSAPLTVRINPRPTPASHSGPWRLSHPG
jgi:hypothetical protein